METLEDRILLSSQPPIPGFHLALLEMGAMITVLPDNAPAAAPAPDLAAAHPSRPHQHQSSGLSYVDPIFNGVEGQALAPTIGTFIDQTPGPAGSYQAAMIDDIELEPADPALYDRFCHDTEEDSHGTT